MIIKKFIIIFAILMSPMIQLNAFEVGEVSEKEEQKDAAEANISGEAIVVTGTKTEKRLKETPVRTEVISGERIENSGAKNLFEIFDKGLLPGVTVNTSCTNCNFTEIRMQGLEGGYSLLLFDGMPVYSALAGVYGLGQIDPVNIERIEVVKGASSALYGSSALGGVINVITKEPQKGKTTASASYTTGFYDQDVDHGSYDANASVGFRMGNMAFLFDGNKHHNDYVLTNDDKYTDKIEQDTQSMNLKSHIYFLDDKHRLTLIGRALHEFRAGGYVGNKTRMIDTDDDGIDDTEVTYNAFDDALDPDAEHITTDRWEWGAGYRANLTTGGILDLNWVRTFHERDATNGARPFHSEEDGYLADVKISQSVFGSHFLSLGSNYKEEKLKQIINYQNDSMKISKTAAGYIQDEWDIIHGLELVLGARYDNVFESSLKEDSAVSPRVALKYDIFDSLVFRASHGWGFKVPTLFAEDLHLCSAAPTVEVPDDLESEKSKSYNASITYYGNKLTCDLNLFRTDIENKINMVFESTPEYDAIFKNSGKAYTQGAEISVSYRIIDPLTINAAYTYTVAKFKNKQLEPGDAGYEDSDNLQRVPDMTGNLSLEYKDKKRGFQATAGGRYIGRQYVQRDMTVDEAGNPLSDPEAHLDHTDGYCVVDAKISKDFKYGDWTYTLFMGCDNIFNYVQDTIYSAEQEDSAAYIYAPVTGRYLYVGAKMSL